MHIQFNHRIFSFVGIALLATLIGAATNALLGLRVWAALTALLVLAKWLYRRRSSKLLPATQALASHIREQSWQLSPNFETKAHASANRSAKLAAAQRLQDNLAKVRQRLA